MHSVGEPLLIDEYYDVFFQFSYFRLTFYSSMTFKRQSYTKICVKHRIDSLFVR